MTEPVEPGFSTAGTTDSRTRRRRKVIIITVLVVVLLTIAGLLGGTAWYRTQNRTFYIPSTSMNPTLQINDRVSTRKLSDPDQIRRGEIVIHDDQSNQDTGVTTLIKRVVGMPGDTVEARGGLVYVNGAPLPEPYLEPGTITRDLRPVTVTPGTYYLLGDNRENSFDSRSYGAVPRAKITHHVKAITFPLDRRRSLD